MLSPTRSSWRKSTLQILLGCVFNNPLNNVNLLLSPWQESLASVFQSGQRNATALSHHGSIQATPWRRVFIRHWWHTLHLKTDLAHPWKKGMVGKLLFFLNGYSLVWLWTIVFIFLGEDKIWVCTRCHVKMVCVQDTFVFFGTFVPNPFSKRYVFCLETRCILCTSVHSPSFGRHPSARRNPVYQWLGFIGWKNGMTRNGGKLPFLPFRQDDDVIKMV